MVFCVDLRNIRRCRRLVRIRCFLVHQLLLRQICLLLFFFFYGQNVLGQCVVRDKITNSKMKLTFGEVSTNCIVTASLCFRLTHLITCERHLRREMIAWLSLLFVVGFMFL